MCNSKKFNLIVLILYLAITILSLFHHEIWKDEAQAWCLARDLNIFDLYSLTKTEGHPLLWYLILFPFAKLHFPVQIIQVLSLLFVSSAVILLLFKSSINNILKILIVFSAGMLYYLPSIARSYSLIPLFIFACAYFYPKRAEKPYFYLLSILFLSHTHVYMLGFCLICFLLYVYEMKNNFNSKNTIPICILFFNFTFIGFSFLHSMNENFLFTEKIYHTLNIADTFLLVSKIFLYKICAFSNFTQKNIGIISLISIYPAILIYLYSLFKINKKVFFVCSISLIYMFLTFSFIYLNGILYQKVFLILLVLIFGLWNAKPDKAGIIAINILFGISLIVSPIVISEDIKYNFSGSKEIAHYIRKNLNSETTFICVGGTYFFSAISAYLPDKKFYNIITKSYDSYFTYDKSKISPEAEYPENAKYSIVPEEIKIPQNNELELLYTSDKANLSSKTQKEIYKIYREIR